MQTENKQTAMIVAGTIVVTTALVIAYFGILKPILNKLGITDDKYDRQAERLDSEESFNPSRARSNPSKVTITESRANVLAQLIFEAKGYIYDNEDQAIGAVRDTGSTYNLSYMSGRFQAIYGRDLLGYMKTFMNSEQLSLVYQSIKNFPK